MAELNSSDRYEIVAELYRRQFGELAPGKDRSPLAGCQSAEEAEENRERWLGWLATTQPLERSLEKIHCMQHQAEQREEALRDASDAKDELRARIAQLETEVARHLKEKLELADRNLELDVENQRLRAELAQVDIAIELLVTARKVNQSTVDTAMSIAIGCAPIDAARGAK